MHFANFFSVLLAPVWRPGRGDGPFWGMGLVFALSVVVAGVAMELLRSSRRRAGTRSSAA